MLEGMVKLSKNLSSSVRTGAPTSLAFHDMGLSTVISYSKVDAFGAAISPEEISKLQMMRRWNNISNVHNKGHFRNLKIAFIIMSKITDKLSLSNSVIERAAYLYRKALEKSLIKGRSIISMVIACVYAACRELNVLRTLDEISDTANTDPRFAARCYRLLLRQLKINYIPRADLNAYLSKAANKSNVSEKTYRKALEILDIVKDNHISSGKNPNALAVAVLYASCLEEGEGISQTQIALAANMSVVTLRKRLSDVRRILCQL